MYDKGMAGQAHYLAHVAVVKDRDAMHRTATHAASERRAIDRSQSLPVLSGSFVPSICKSQNYVVHAGDGGLRSALTSICLKATSFEPLLVTLYESRLATSVLPFYFAFYDYRWTYTIKWYTYNWILYTKTIEIIIKIRFLEIPNMQYTHTYMHAHHHTDTGPMLRTKCQASNLSKWSKEEKKNPKPCWKNSLLLLMRYVYGIKPIYGWSLVGRGRSRITQLITEPRLGSSLDQTFSANSSRHVHTYYKMERFDLHTLFLSIYWSCIFCIS